MPMTYPKDYSLGLLYTESGTQEVRGKDREREKGGGERCTFKNYVQIDSN